MLRLPCHLVVAITLLVTATAAIASPPKVVRTLRGHTGRIDDASISADNNFVVTVSGDKTARLWDATGATIQTFGDPNYAARAARFSPDGTMLAVAIGREVQLWDVKANKEVRMLIGSGDMLWFSPDGTRLAAMGMTSMLVVWDIATRKPAWSVDKAFAVNADSELWSPDGKQIIAALEKETQLLDVATGKVLQTLPRKETYYSWKMPWLTTKFTGSGRLVFSYDANDGDLYGWDTSDASVLMAAKLTVTIGDKKASSMQTAGRGATFDPTGASMLSYTGAGGSALSTVYDLAKGAKKFGLAGKPDVNHATYNVAGTRIATCNFANKLMLWDATNGKLLGQVTAHSDIIPTLHFSPDGTRLVTPSYDKTAKVWDVSGN